MYKGLVNNVDGVDTKKVEGQATDSGRLPFGLPGTNAKTGAISNANSLWIQYFYAYLNSEGRAGFVMASSASDAGNKDRDIREKLVKTGHVDVMMAIGNKFFYTRSLPCTLWFFDKGKPQDLQDQVLMIDARNVYHVVSARSHIFTDEQHANLNAIVWLYRGEIEKVTSLIHRYQRQAAHWLDFLPERMAADSAAVDDAARLLQRFADNAVLDELNAGYGTDMHITPEAWASFQNELGVALVTPLAASVPQLLQAAAEASQRVAPINGSHLVQGSYDHHLAVQHGLGGFDGLVAPLKQMSKALEARHKQWLKLLDTADKTLRARQLKGMDGKDFRAVRRALLAADSKKNEPPTVRDEVLEALRQAIYFIHQAHWIQSRFPNGWFEDVPGLCKAVTLDEIAANDYSLTPGRYVGVAAATAEDEEDFAERLREIHDELAELNDKAVELAGRIAGNFEELLG